MKMKNWHKMIFGLTLSSTIATASFLYGGHLRQESIRRCERILQESQIQDQYFCESLIRRDTFFELIDSYKLEDGRLAYILTKNKQGK